MKPSRASSYSDSDDCAPSRARGRPPRSVMHQRRNQVVEVAAGRGQGPSEGHFIREGAFRRPRRPQNDRILVACVVRRTRAQKRSRPERACGGTIFQRLFGAAGAVCGVVLAIPSI